MLQKRAAKYFFFKDGELFYEDKQYIIRSIVRKIQIFRMKSRCLTFKLPENRKNGLNTIALSSLFSISIPINPGNGFIWYFVGFYRYES